MNDDFGGLKLLLSYEVKQDVINEYRQFVMRDYVPSMHNLGFQMSEAWHTAYGDAPNRLVGFVCRDRSTLDQLLDSSEWSQLNTQLRSYVTDFSYKVVPYRNIFQF